MLRSRTLILPVVAVLAAGSAAVWAVTPAAAATPTATFVKVSDWGSGWQGQYTITNGHTSPMATWTIEFDLPSGTSVGPFWAAAMTRSGKHHTFTNESWNGAVNPGASVSFGFLGNGSGSPDNCRLNGRPCAGGAAPTEPSAAPSTTAPARPTTPATTAPTTRPPTTRPPATEPTGRPPAGGTPVAANGQLKVCGTRLCNSRGDAVQLRGMSTHGLQWFETCLTPASLDVLAKDWKADVLRIAMYVQEDGYETDPRRFTDLVHKYIEMATDRGMYALVDWHILNPGDPNHNLDRARTFFTEIANRHKNKTNILYEIANEPNGVEWAAVKRYADQIIPVIRDIDPDSVIVVGTPHWSSLGVSGSGNQERDIINNPLRHGNLMYAFHFYAASHGDNYYDTLARAAETLPVFVTEFGTEEASGDGRHDFARAQRYLDLMASKKISWVNWNYSDDFRSGAVFTPGTCDSGAFSAASRLKEGGAWIRDRVRTPDRF